MNAWTAILAGGRGTRLASAVPDRPKILAPVGDGVFLDHLIAQLRAQGLTRLHFLLGHRHADVTEALAARGLEASASVEPEPLGTAGALKHGATAAMAAEDFFLMNGDTYVDFDAAGLLAAHRATGAAVTLAAIPVDDIGRYGGLELDGDRVRGFSEKSVSGAPGLINGGIYVIAPRVLESIAPRRAVSLETEVLPALLLAGERLTAVPQSGTFYDIGTPASLAAFARFAAGPRERP